MQNSSAFSVDSLMGKKTLDSKTNDVEKESERKSAFSVAPPLPKREFHPPSVCNCQPCQQTAVSGFTAMSQAVAEPRFMSLQSMAGTVSVPAPVYLPKGEWILIHNWSLKLNFYELDERIIFVSAEPYVIQAATVDLDCRVKCSCC